jgi:uncharacterized Zn-finger protein
MPRRRSTSLQPALTTALDGTTLYGCPQCHTVFNNREAIETHLTIHRSERPFICNDCGAALKRKEHLDRHRSSHMTERPHPCPVCSKTFKRIVSFSPLFFVFKTFLFLLTSRFVFKHYECCFLLLRNTYKGTRSFIELIKCTVVLNVVKVSIARIT